MMTKKEIYLHKAYNNGLIYISMHFQSSRSYFKDNPKEVSVALLTSTVIGLLYTICWIAYQHANKNAQSNTKQLQTRNAKHLKDLSTLLNCIVAESKPLYINLGSNERKIWPPFH